MMVCMYMYTVQISLYLKTVIIYYILFRCDCETLMLFLFLLLLPLSSFTRRLVHLCHFELNCGGISLVQRGTDLRAFTLGIRAERLSENLGSGGELLIRDRVSSTLE